jgi:hypothetical protein
MDSTNSSAENLKNASQCKCKLFKRMRRKSTWNVEVEVAREVILNLDVYQLSLTGIVALRNGRTGMYKIVLAYQKPQKSLVNLIKRKVIVNIE